MTVQRVCERENEEPEELAFIRYADIKGLIKNI